MNTCVSGFTNSMVYGSDPNRGEEKRNSGPLEADVYVLQVVVGLNRSYGCVILLTLAQPCTFITN